MRFWNVLLGNLEWCYNMKKRLGILEEKALRRKGADDLRGNAFFEYLPPNYVEPILVSAFVSYELVQLAVESQYLFEQRWHIVSLRDEGGKPYYRVMRMSEALALIETRVEQMNARVQKKCLRYEAPVRKLRRALTKAQQEGARHLEVMHNNNLFDMECKLKDELMGLYQTVESLLGEKIRLLKNASGQYNTLERRRFLRIQCYYGAACEAKRTVKFLPPKMGDFEGLIDRSVPEFFQKDLENAQRELKNITNKIQELSELKKG